MSLKITDTNVTIMVKDMDASISFYQNIGFELKARWGEHYAMVTAAGITIGIHPGGANKTASEKISIGFMIDKIEDAKSLLESNGIEYKFFDDQKSGLYCNFTDPDGTYLYFTQPTWK